MEEIEFDIDTLTLRGKRWRLGDKPVLALHGWMDNCASFDFLAPELQGLDIVAIDLAGHGKSDHRGWLGAYNIWQDIAEILSVADQLGWETFGLLGHSRGAMISTLIAGTFPDRITHLALVESVLPPPSAPEDTPKQLAEAIENVMRLQKRPRHYYPSMKDAIEARSKGIVALSVEDSEVLASRGVAHDGTGFYWANDPLLMAKSEVKFTHDQIMAFMNNITVPVALIVAENGLLVEHDLLPEWVESSSRIQSQLVSGDHHLHMSQRYKDVAAFFNEYYSSDYLPD